MKALKHLNKYFWKYRVRFTLGIIFVASSNLFALVPPKVIQVAFDIVKDSIQTLRLFNGFGSSAMFAEILLKTFFFLFVVIVASYILRGFLMFLMRQTLIVMSRMIEYDLKNEIYDQYQRLSLAFYKRNSTGDLMARISEDVIKVRMYIGPALMYSINLVVLFILVIAIMFSVNVKLAFYVLLPLPILSLTIYYVSHLINIKSEQVQRQLSALSTFVQETFSGIRVLKAYTREKDVKQRFDKECITYKGKSLELVKINALFFPFMLVLIGVSTILTVYVGGKQAIAGQITTGNIAEFIVYINMLTWPVAALGWVTSIIQRAAASQERINEFLKEQPEIINPSNEPCEITGSVEFNSVSFTYPDSGIMALKDVSFKIEPGKSLAIIGRTGAGKSTIAALINRLYDVDNGQILIDGNDIKTTNLDVLRKSIGYVPQEVFLFSDSILSNITYGIKRSDQNSNLQAVAEKAAIHAAIYDNIVEFPERFETLLGERGITLSGGQKQRISIARAIIRSPQILIFDDCLSAVDTQTEEIILGNLRQIMKGKSTIIISHRVSSIKDVDEIIVLEKGSIIERGTHEMLLNLEGAYYQLYQKQLLEEQEEML